MPETADIELLQQYARNGVDEAFARLVSRHVNLVYSAALRKTGNPAAAEEVTQAVFIILARKASRMNPRVVLSGWLYQTTRLTAASFLRNEYRRIRREQEAYMQSLSHEPDPEAWAQIVPLLEDAMGRLNETDRNAIVLRFFEGKSFEEVGAAVGASENAAKKRVGHALEKLRKFFSRRGVVSTAAAIAGVISANSVQAAPVALTQSITVVALAKGAAASGSTLTLINGALKLMAWTKAKTAVMTGAIILLTTGTTLIAIKAVHRARVAAYPDIQGAWEGLFESGNQKLPLRYDISKANGTYRGIALNPYQGVREHPVSTLTYNYPSIHIEQSEIGFTYDATLDKNTMEMSGTWKQHGGSGPFKLKLNPHTDAFPEPLTESEFAPRTGSAVQGSWKGTVKAGNTPLRVVIRIAELSNGTFRAEGDSIDQGLKGMLATAVSYQAPTLRIEFGGVGGVFEGTVDERGRAIKGAWTQGGKPLPMNLDRTDPTADEAQDLKKDFSHTSPNDLPGHWQGTLDVKQEKLKLRLALDIARLPDDSFSCLMISLDQGGSEVPASAVQFVAPNLHLEWPALGAAYNARLENGKLSGTFRQGNSSMPLAFERSGMN